jgi:hypothetical protein
VSTPHPGRVFYHYTDAAGLIGILKNRELWATNILHLNDASEFTQAVRTANSQVKSEGLAWRLDSFDELIKDPESLMQMGSDFPFVVSFSENGNQLSHDLPPFSLPNETRVLG